MEKLALFQAAWTLRAQAILRIMAALLFIQHGTQKLFNFPPSGREVGELSMLMLSAGLLEFVGGLLFLVGLFTRSTAFVLCGMMAVAYFMAHGSQGFYPINNRGDLAVLFCFVFFYYFFAGAGAWSVDETIARKKAAA